MPSDVAGLVGALPEFVRVQIFQEQRRPRLHRINDVGHRRELFVFDFHECGGFFGNVNRVGSDRDDSVTAIQHLIGSQDIVAEMLEVGGPFAEVHHDIVGNVTHILVRGDGSHAGKLGRLVRTDRFDASVRVRAADDGSEEHPGQPHVSSVFRPASDFIDAIVADGTGSNDVIFGFAGNRLVGSGHAKVSLRSMSGAVAE